MEPCRTVSLNALEEEVGEETFTRIPLAQDDSNAIVRCTPPSILHPPTAPWVDPQSLVWSAGALAARTAVVWVVRPMVKWSAVAGLAWFGFYGPAVVAWWVL